MTSLLQLCVVLFIAAFGQSYASLDDVPEDTEYAYGDLIPDSPSIQLVGKTRFRRDAAPPHHHTTGKKRTSIFDAIMKKAMHIKHNHPHNKHLYRRTSSRRTSTRNSRYTRKVYKRPYRYTRRTYTRPVSSRRTSTSRTYRRTYKRPYKTTYVRRTPSRTRQVVPNVRRIPTKSTSKSKPSLFHRIMNRVTKIKEDHGKNVPTRKIQPPSSRWSSKRKPIEKKPTTNVPKKKKSIFHSILSRVNQIKNNHPHHRRPGSRWSPKPKVVERKPTRSWSSKSGKVVEEKPTRSRSGPVEEKPTRSRSKPIEEKPTGSWSPKRKIVEKSPVKVIQPVERVSQASAPKGKPTLFDNIIRRVNQIKDNHRHKGVVIKKPPKYITPVVAGAAGGLLAASVLNKMKNVYKADDKRVMKVASWNVFEGKGSRKDLDMGRAEICDKLKLLDLTAFGLQGAINDQITVIKRCLPASQYTYHRGRGRYDWNIRRYVYNPVFYVYRNKNIRSRGSGSISLRNNDNRIISAATYVKLRFSTKNNRFSNHGVESEVLIVNVNIRGNSPQENTKQLKYVLHQVQHLSRHGRAPVILMGDTKQSEKNLKSILDSHAYRHTKLHNTLNKAFNPNAYASGTRDISNNVFSYILEHKLNTIFAATITDNLKTPSYRPSSQKPIFAAFEMP